MAMSPGRWNELVAWAESTDDVTAQISRAELREICVRVRSLEGRLDYTLSTLQEIAVNRDCVANALAEGAIENISAGFVG